MTAYLEMAKAELPDMKSGVISFWIKFQQPGSREDLWPADWEQPHIDQEVTDKRIAFPGASYHYAYPQLVTPHLWAYPPGPEPANFSPPWQTFKHNFTPFITFGDPKQKYKRVIWKTRDIEADYFYVGPGIGHTTIISQFPEPEADEPNIVPPSMIGWYTGSFTSPPGLRVVLQTKDRPTLQGYAWAMGKAERVTVLTPSGDPEAFPIGKPTLPDSVYAWVNFYETGSLLTCIPSPLHAGEALFYTDVSRLECAQHPEAFVMDIQASIADNKWHHIVISFDLTGENTEASESKSGENGALADGTFGADWGSAYGPNIPAYTPPPPPSEDGGTPMEEANSSEGAGGVCKAEAYGPAGTPPWPGPYGAWPGTAQLGFNGEPFEDCGKYGYADGGMLSSSCRAWVAIDGVKYDGENLIHGHAAGALKARGGTALIKGLDPNAILPPNAFLAPFSEIRQSMTTSLTLWERMYRTALGGFDGPPCNIEETGELRRQDHHRPRYEFKPGALPTNGHPIGIPAGSSMTDRNTHIYMAELQIWSNKSLDVTLPKNNLLFMTKDGEPEVNFKEVEKVLGKPHVRLHGSGNWKKGNNTGTLGYKITGSGPTRKKEKLPQGQFVRSGKIKRRMPDPEKGES